MDAVRERRPPNWGRVARRLGVWVLIAVPTLLALALLFSADARYLARAGVEEAGILLRRRSMARLLADPKTPAPPSPRLRALLAARAHDPHPLTIYLGGHLPSSFAPSRRWSSSPTHCCPRRWSGTPWSSWRPLSMSWRTTRCT